MDFPPEARALLAELSAIPYENLSKVVAKQGRARENALNFSASWMEDHRRLGLGGTCFALTHWLKIKMDALGFSTAYLMADKRRDKNIHCGLQFESNGRAYLLDPGYLIFSPLSLPGEDGFSEAHSAPNSIRLEDVADTGAWRLFTGPAGGLKHRFDFRKEPVASNEFQRHWENSYDWPMMRYPVLNRVAEGTQYYLQKNNLLVRTEAGSRMTALSPAQVSETAQTLFGLPRALVEEALEILKFPRSG